MSKSKSNLETPIGRVRTVMIGNVRYYMIKDVCAGIGLQGHSPWSWHVNAGNNRERFYKRYDLNRRRETKHASAKDTVTVITREGLNDYLRSPYIIKKPRAMMFKTWLDAHLPLEEMVSAEVEKPELVYPTLDEIADQKGEIPTRGETMVEYTERIVRDALNARKAVPDDGKSAKHMWGVAFCCPNCNYMTVAPTNFCPDCGEMLEAPTISEGVGA